MNFQNMNCAEGKTFCCHLKTEIWFCCSELHLATTWPHLAEGIVVDNDVYS